MNIYFLDKNADLCAEYHSDKHVVLKTLETSFILSNAHWLSLFYSEDPENCEFLTLKDMKQYFEKKYDENNPLRPPYKMSKLNNPHIKWLIESKTNYIWCVDLLKSLNKQFEIRYGKTHKTKQQIEWFENNIPTACKDCDITEFPITLDEVYITVNDAVASYRNFYIIEKSDNSTWKNGKPLWIK